MAPKNLLTSTQVAEQLEVNRTTVHRWAERGDLKVADTVAGIRLFDPKVVNRFAAERAGTPA